jgi:hypothetical protein
MWQCKLSESYVIAWRAEGTDSLGTCRSFATQEILYGGDPIIQMSMKATAAPEVRAAVVLIAN